ncbi:MAG: type I DNA topoisomerase [Pseudomonadota bacterium]
MSLVVVESPAKAKTINKYLGSKYQVIASFGHITELPSKTGSVEPDKDFVMHYQVDSRSEKHVKELVQAAKNSKEIFLATDPDREGEAISWHVVEQLKQRGAIKNQPVYRVSFNEITKQSVTHAINNPRPLDTNLINAQQARLALDYLVGFTLSPVLWRKLPGSRSAGRVQSVALRIICEREHEIKQFISQEYWQIKGLFTTEQNHDLETSLFEYQGNKLEKFSIPNEGEASKIVNQLKPLSYSITDIQQKDRSRRPQAAFNTSSLQQEASRKLGFSARRTMQTAQKLYEGIDIKGETVGLITYMRTDGIQMAAVAIDQVRDYILKQHGNDYLPAKPNVYQKKAKNAQEAHEAIRPTNFFLPPKQARAYLNDDQAKIYELVWRRAVASQMTAAKLKTTTIIISDEHKTASFKATGSVVVFPGFLTLYEEGRDDKGNSDDGKILPAVNLNQALTLNDIVPSQHFTEPPPRYSEASLVKKLEELGIGRPSTYASIISVLQDRNYVRLDSRRFIPEDRGVLVTAFLTNFFTKYVEYDFTADLEQQLDEVSAGNLPWKDLLKTFWDGFSGTTSQAMELTITTVLESLKESLAFYLFATGEKNNTKIDTKCPKCDTGELELRLGKYGAFIACNNYPECTYTRTFDSGSNKDENSDIAQENQLLDLPHSLGNDPKTGLEVTIRKGPYGFYLQLGEGDKDNKPKRSPAPKNTKLTDINLAQALELLALPRELGNHPDDGQPVVSNIGKYGDYVRYNSKFYKIARPLTAKTITFEEALFTILEQKDKKAKTSSKGKATGSSKKAASGKTKATAKTKKPTKKASKTNK